MPCGWRSRAITWAKPRTANLAGANAAEFGHGVMPAVAPVIRIAPLPRDNISGTNARAHRKAPNACNRQVCSKTSGVVSSNRPIGRRPPLKIKISTGPSSRLICSCARLDGGIALDRKRDAARVFDCAADLADDLRAPCDQRDLVVRGEAPGQGCAETFADADH